MIEQTVPAAALILAAAGLAVATALALAVYKVLLPIARLLALSADLDPPKAVSSREPSMHRFRLVSYWSAGCDSIRRSATWSSRWREILDLYR